MSLNKTITIDPEMFKIKINPDQKKTRKKKTDDPSKIKFKPPANKTVKYNKLLKYIREKQNKNYESLFNKKNDHAKEAWVGNDQSLPPKGELEEPLKFLNEIREKTNSSTPQPAALLQQLPPLAILPTPKETYGFQVSPSAAFPQAFPPTSPPRNYTIKQYGKIPGNATMNLPSYLSPMVETGIEAPSWENSTPFKIEPPPQYGVLKNGKLPTYREYTRSFVNETVENSPLALNNQDLQHRANMVKITSEKNGGGGGGGGGGSGLGSGGGGGVKGSTIVFPKRKKTIKRTFRVGRSKYYSKIGVLINNKTIRDECSTKKHLLKQTTLGEIKRFLVKKGLIKVGSNAPNDVLRKMYESVNMICGDVQNHNTDILLHNYFNDGKD